MLEFNAVLHILNFGPVDIEAIPLKTVMELSALIRYSSGLGKIPFLIEHIAVVIKQDVSAGVSGISVLVLVQSCNFGEIIVLVEFGFHDFCMETLRVL